METRGPLRKIAIHDKEDFLLTGVELDNRNALYNKFKAWIGLGPAKAAHP